MGLDEAREEVFRKIDAYRFCEPRHGQWWRGCLGEALKNLERAAVAQAARADRPQSHEAVAAMEAG